MPDIRQWTDQPSVIEGATIFYGRVGERLVQVIQSDVVKDQFFVTTGNLFGSQTITVQKANNVLRILELIANSVENKQIELPSYATFC